MDVLDSLRFTCDVCNDQIASSAFQTLHNEMVENAFKTYLVTEERGIK